VALTIGIAKAEPVTGGTLRVLVHPEPPHVVLALGQASGTATISSQIFDSLVWWSISDSHRRSSKPVRWSIPARWWMRFQGWCSFIKQVGQG